MTTREKFRLKRLNRKIIENEHKSIKAFEDGVFTSPYSTVDIEEMVLNSVEDFNTWMK